MSFSWLEPVQQRRVATGIPFGVYTARVKSSVIASFFRLVFTAIAIVIIVALDPQLDSVSIMEYGLKNLNDPALMYPFIVQVVASFIG